MNSISTLPVNLCLKQSERPSKDYEVRSLEDIPAGIRFGPYQEMNKCELKDGFQSQMKTENKLLFVDSGSGRNTNWLPYVNYAHNEEEPNLITFHGKSGVYYITCRPIPVNAELLLCKKDISVGDRKECICKTGNKEGNKLYVIENDHNGNNKNKGRGSYMRDALQCILSKNKVIKEWITTSVKQCEENKNYMISKNNNGTKSPVNGDSTEYAYKCKKDSKSCKNSFSCDKEIYELSRMLKPGECDNIPDWSYICNIYEKIFACQNNLNTHSCKKHFEHNACGKKFWDGKRVQSSEKPYNRIKCGNEFSCRNSLVKHQKFHCGQKLYSCNECKKKFKTYSGFKIHKMIHTGEKPYECSTCGNKFVSKGSSAGTVNRLIV